MIIASIDIGTNTVLLLIAEVNPITKEIKPLLNEFRIPRIGKGLKSGGLISPKKNNELLNILERFLNIIKKYNCEKTLITATNAFRTAANGKEIATQIYRKFKVLVNIIQGNDEARFSFLGAVSGIPVIKSTLVIDIGGGSTELIFGTIDEIKFKKSFPVGAVSGTEKYFPHDPPSKKDIENINEFLDQTFSFLQEHINLPEISIAIAGTPTTLACIKMNLKEFDEEKIEGSILYRNEIHKLILNLSELSSYKIKEKYKSIVEGRQDILLSGTLILYKIMEIIDIDKVTVSTKGIRYGAIVDYLNQTFKD